MAHADIHFVLAAVDAVMVANLILFLLAFSRSIMKSFSHELASSIAVNNQTAIG
jgi:hypothetical protein